MRLKGNLSSVDFRMDHGPNHRRYLYKNEWHRPSFRFFKIKKKNPYIIKDFFKRKF